MVRGAVPDAFKRREGTAAEVFLSNGAAIERKVNLVPSMLHHGEAERNKRVRPKRFFCFFPSEFLAYRVEID